MRNWGSTASRQLAFSLSPAALNGHFEPQAGICTHPMLIISPSDAAAQKNKDYRPRIASEHVLLPDVLPQPVSSVSKVARRTQTRGTFGGSNNRSQLYRFLSLILRLCACTNDARCASNRL